MKKLIKKIFDNWLPIVLVIFCLTPLIWFITYGHGGKIINGVDTNFPLNPLTWFGRRFFVWNSIPNGGIDFSASLAGMFFHLVQVIPYLLGLSLQKVEITSLIFWFTTIVVSSYWFAKSILPKNKLAQVLFVCFYSFNIYLFNTWENVKVSNLALVAGLPIVLAILINLNENRIKFTKSAILASFAGLILSGTGINPAYFIALLLGVLIYVICDLVVSKNDRKRKFKNFLGIILIVVLVNSFWIFPTVYYISRNIPASGSIENIGFNNWIDSLSENTSIFNIMRLQGAWDWYSLDSITKLPLYIPYALNYFYRFPFIVFSLILPSFSLLSLAFRDKKKNSLYLSFSLMTVLGIFLGVGTHAPTGVLFSFFLKHIPFFSLFRSPWYIFTPILIIGYSGLAALLFGHLSDILNDKRQRVLRSGLILIGGVLLIGNLIYSYPLVTGKIFRAQRNDSFFVKFPDYIKSANTWLNSQEESGRVLNYPDDEIENFSWGYRGIESILQLGSNKEVVFSSLNAQNLSLSGIIKSLYSNLKKGQMSSFYSLGSKLNLGYIFEKGDQPSLSPSLPNEIKNQIKPETFGPWNFYKLPSDEYLPKIFFADDLSYYSPANSGQVALSVLDKKTQLINPEDSVVNEFDNDRSNFGRVIVADNLQAKDFSSFSNSPSQLANRLIARDVSKATFVFDISEDGFYQPVLERFRIGDFGISINKPLLVEIDKQSRFLTIERLSDSFVFFNLQRFDKGTHTLVFPLINQNLVEGGDFEGEEQFERGGYGEGNVIYQVEKGENGSYLSLFNLDRAEQSANFSINRFEPFIPYYIELRYKQIYGNNGLVVTDQGNERTLVKAQSERLPNYPEWRNFSFYYQPVETESDMRVSLIAPYTKDVLGTKILYDDLSVKKVFTNNLMLVKSSKESLSTPELKFQKISPVYYKGTVEKGTGTEVLTFLENYSPNWELSIYDSNGLKIKSTTRHFTVNLYANGWFITNTPESYSFRLYYKPQKIFYLGIVTSALTFLFGTYAYLLKNKKI